MLLFHNPVLYKFPIFLIPTSIYSGNISSNRQCSFSTKRTTCHLIQESVITDLFTHIEARLITQTFPRQILLIMPSISVSDCTILYLKINLIHFQFSSIALNNSLCHLWNTLRSLQFFLTSLLSKSFPYIPWYNVQWKHILTHSTSWQVYPFHVLFAFDEEMCNIDMHIISLWYWYILRHMILMKSVDLWTKIRCPWSMSSPQFLH